MVIHPTEADLMYVRTDVGGVYRWSPGTRRWIQLLTEGHGLTSGGGAESLTISRLGPDTVFMAKNGGIYRSIDRGLNWSLGAGTSAIEMGPNDPYRWYGERLAVDPQNADVVYFGSRKDGLMRSLDGGATFSTVIAVPAGLTLRDDTGGEVDGTSIGIGWVVIDASGGLSEGRSSRLYAGVAGQGIWSSLDGGETWANLSGGSGPATGVIPSDAELAPNGRLWVSAIGNYTRIGTSWTQALGGLWSWDPTSGAWDTRRPGGGDDDWSEVAVDPTNPDRVIVADQGFGTYVTNDGGTSWRYGAPNVSNWQAPNAPWVDVTVAASQLWRQWSSPGALNFDPHSSGRLWYAEGFGVWATDNVDSDEVVWTNQSFGIEETVAFGAVHPPGGVLVTAVADLSGYYHDQGTGTAPSARILEQGFTTTTSLAWCLETPSFIAAVSVNHHSDWLDHSGYSDDGGRTWRGFASLVNGDHPAELKFGSIAVSANSTSKLVWAPWNYGALHYTADGGASWRRGVIKGTNDHLTDLHYATAWANSAAVVADGHEADTFYAYQRPYGEFYRSTDGGATWTLRSKNPGTLDWMEGEGGMVNVPGYPGHLWFAAAPHGQDSSWFQQGLWRSTDGAVTWTMVMSVDDARMVAIGPAAPSSSYPTVFAHAQVGGVEGIYRSTNEGESWVKLTVTTNPLGLIDAIRSISADWNTFGRVYVGFGGNGFAVGQPK